ncbi:hypothetical protein GOP47_0009270 [Adiantum capillus-veneris]|uniref:RING-CH-type domain-containing protein n=1 Tax=Adiantum capillus-veneris TaxID=13818 RepID=A0A9D4UWK6_ADICA|nr:hypothetical protein GOP47_0009270 [Adiantum capillus-veneris]
MPFFLHTVHLAAAAGLSSSRRLRVSFPTTTTARPSCEIRLNFCLRSPGEERPRLDFHSDSPQAWSKPIITAWPWGLSGGIQSSQPPRVSLRAISVVVENEPPVSIIEVAQEGQTASNIGNPRANNCPPSALPEECRAEYPESEQIDQNPKWVAVDLSPCIREDACKVQLRVVGENQAADSLKLDLRVAGEPSTSNALDACLTYRRDSSIEISTDQQYQLQQHSITITVQMPPPQPNSVDPLKGQEAGFVRTVSAMSTESTAEHCRICQLTADEPLIELGCHCRGELAKAHRSCIQQWFNNKGSNKCEVCRQVATNLPAPISPPMHNFWVWRRSHSYRHGPLRRWQGRGQFHPLVAALLILVAGLMFDVLISYYLGASALPVNIIIGVLVVLGLGTGARLIMECCHHRSVSRSIRRMEIAADMDHLHSANGL